MGCWGVDPFDNDTAAVWLIRFEETPADRRHAMIRAALAGAVAGSDVYLDSDFAFEAIAAASVLAGDEHLGRGADLFDLAVTALDRIGGDQSEWRSLWEEAGREPLGRALGRLGRLRAAVRQARRRLRVTAWRTRGRERTSGGELPDGDEIQAGPLIYLTYTKYHPVDGRVFHGRINGRGEPRRILESYDRHHALARQGYQAAVLDVWCEATKPSAARLSDRAYQAIRGREHLGIVANSENPGS